jgi:hypothetical protein
MKTVEYRSDIDFHMSEYVMAPSRLGMFPLSPIGTSDTQLKYVLDFFGVYLVLTYL